eukprot:6672606-Prymnesium_polylepis.1
MPNDVNEALEQTWAAHQLRDVLLALELLEKSPAGRNGPRESRAHTRKRGAPRFAGAARSRPPPLQRAAPPSMSGGLCLCVSRARRAHMVVSFDVSSSPMNVLGALRWIASATTRCSFVASVHASSAGATSTDGIRKCPGGFAASACIAQSSRTRKATSAADGEREHTVTSAVVGRQLLKREII